MKVKINLDEYNLRYEQPREDGDGVKVFFVKRIISGDYRIYDPETKTVDDISRKKLRTYYKRVRSDVDKVA